jgi:hypothetical protein
LTQIFVPLWHVEDKVECVAVVLVQEEMNPQWPHIDQIHHHSLPQVLQEPEIHRLSPVQARCHWSGAN